MPERDLIRGVELVHETIVADGLSTSGPPVIWAHGLTSSRRAEVESPLLDLDAVAQVSRVLRYDARGHGESGLSVELARYGWDEMALDQLALATHLGIDRYVAAGASLGAATALQAAVAAPDRVAALVLVIPPTAWETRAAQSELYGSMADVVERSGTDALARAAAIVPPPDPLRDRPEWREARLRRLRQADPVRLATVFRGAATTDLPRRDRIAAIAAPTLVLAWTGDDGHPVSTAEELERLMPKATARYATTYEEFVGWSDLVVDFVTSLSRST